MMQTSKTLLFNDSQPWLKKFGSEDFDVPIGCFDGAEVSELVGSFILTKFYDVLQRENVELYRDGGLAIVKQMPGPELERKRKKIIEIFKKYGLAITIKTNLFVVNFLDIQFNLLNGTFKPYRKPNNDPIYVHKDSNHPPQVLKELPKTIGKRISTISSSREIFESSKIEYENVLKISGYKDRLVYKNSSVNENDKHEKKKRKRNIIWYNPPYSANVKTNNFFKLLNKHFPRGQKFQKIFNKNTVKLSYSSTKNMASLITKHNRSILNPNNRVYGWKVG